MRQSCLLARSWLYPLRSRPGLPLPGWALDADGGPLGDATAVVARRLSLAAALKLAGAPSMQERYPVAAVGSNASPGQLSHKFTSGRFVSETMPMTVARVSGVAVGHSAHVSKAGYVPYVPVAARPAAVRDLVILWLDRTQLERINETEPNYDLVTVGRDHEPALLESGEPVCVFSLYRGRWGALRPARELPALPASGQAEVFGLLAALPWFGALVPEIRAGARAAMRALAGDERRRTDVRERLAGEGLAAGDGLPAGTATPLAYGSGTKRCRARLPG